jgi:hypothetical protein
MMWSTLLCVPSPWPVSTDVKRKSVDRVDVADTLKEIRMAVTSALPTLLIMDRYS